MVKIIENNNYHKHDLVLVEKLYCTKLQKPKAVEN